MVIGCKFALSKQIFKIMEIILYLFAAYLIMLGLGLVASIAGLFMKRWRKYAICYLWWALFPFCFPDYAKDHGIIRKGWKRLVLFFVSPCPFSVYLVVLLFVGLVTSDSGRPSSTDYHTAKDLARATGVEFPEVVPVDSFYYEAFRTYYVDVKFVPLRSMTKKDFEKFDKACETDSCCWRKDSTGYTYHIYPEYPLDRTKGSHRRKVEVDGEMVDDWDGGFVTVFVPFKGDTITIRDGWLP